MPLIRIYFALLKVYPKKKLFRWGLVIHKNVTYSDFEVYISNNFEKRITFLKLCLFELVLSAITAACDN